METAIPRRLCVVSFFFFAVNFVAAQEPAQPTWSYSPELLRPFWQGETSEGESVLFIKDEKTGEARALVLFPIREVLAVKNSVGDVTFENGKDFVWKADSREIVIPAGSRIATKTSAELRRPAKFRLGIIGCGGIMTHHVKGLVDRRQSCWPRSFSPHSSCQPVRTTFRTSSTSGADASMPRQ